MACCLEGRPVLETRAADTERKTLLVRKQSFEWNAYGAELPLSSVSISRVIRVAVWCRASRSTSSSAWSSSSIFELAGHLGRAATGESRFEESLSVLGVIRGSMSLRHGSSGGAASSPRRVYESIAASLATSLTKNRNHLDTRRSHFLACR